MKNYASLYRRWKNGKHQTEGSSPVGAAGNHSGCGGLPVSAGILLFCVVFKHIRPNAHSTTSKILPSELNLIILVMFFVPSNSSLILPSS